MNVLQFDFLTDTDFKFEISFNDQIIDYELADNQIWLSTNFKIGFHLLKIKLIQGSRVQILKAKLDGVDFRQTLYTMYTVDKQSLTRRQTTIITDYDNVVYLPFINPVAHWISTTAELIPYDIISNGLYDQYDVYYPESVVLPDYYPKLIRDFFETDFGFYAHPKTDAYYNETVPYAELGIKFPEDLANELLDNLDYLNSQAKHTSQQEYNNSNNPWSVVNLIVPENNEFLIDKNQLPRLYNFIQQLKLEKIIYAYIGMLPPGEYVSPHVDLNRRYNFTELKGCCQIYVPINFKPGNYFKIANVGLLPTDRPMLVNNQNFAHALVNNSNEYRFALGIIGSRING